MRKICCVEPHFRNTETRPKRQKRKIHSGAPSEVLMSSYFEDLAATGIGSGVADPHG
jgi:hypothetical protein